MIEQMTRRAFSLALESAGRSIAARIAMIAITTSNSINVKPSEVVTRFSFVAPGSAALMEYF